MKINLFSASILIILLILFLFFYLKKFFFRFYIHKNYEVKPVNINKKDLKELFILTLEEKYKKELYIIIFCSNTPTKVHLKAKELLELSNKMFSALKSSPELFNQKKALIEEMYQSLTNINTKINRFKENDWPTSITDSVFNGYVQITKVFNDIYKDGLRSIKESIDTENKVVKAMREKKD